LGNRLFTFDIPFSCQHAPIVFVDLGPGLAITQWATPAALPKHGEAAAHDFRGGSDALSRAYILHDVRNTSGFTAKLPILEHERFRLGTIFHPREESKKRNNGDPNFFLIGFCYHDSGMIAPAHRPVPRTLHGKAVLYCARKPGSQPSSRRAFATETDPDGSAML
jgi:hypothetical protein